MDKWCSLSWNCYHCQLQLLLSDGLGEVSLPSPPWNTPQAESHFKSPGLEVWNESPLEYPGNEKHDGDSLKHFCRRMIDSRACYKLSCFHVLPCLSSWWSSKWCAWGSKDTSSQSVTGPKCAKGSLVYRPKEGAMFCGCSAHLTPFLDPVHRSRAMQICSSCRAIELAQARVDQCSFWGLLQGKETNANTHTQTPPPPEDIAEAILVPLHSCAGNSYIGLGDRSTIGIHSTFANEMKQNSSL